MFCFLPLKGEPRLEKHQNKPFKRKKNLNRPQTKPPFKRRRNAQRLIARTLTRTHAPESNSRPADRIKTISASFYSSPNILGRGIGEEFRSPGSFPEDLRLNAGSNLSPEFPRLPPSPGNCRNHSRADTSPLPPPNTPKIKLKSR